VTDYDVWAEEHGVTALPLKQQPSRITMDEYGLELAAVVAKRAACTRRKVGAVIIGPDKRIIATGYNGLEPGAVECSDGGCPRGSSDLPVLPRSAGNTGMSIPCIARHAEANAVQYVLHNNGRDPDEASQLLAVSTLYCTHESCPDCAALCEHHGLRVVWPW
jgi:dCMP deaminase